jgi:hypothetical protein
VALFVGSVLLFALLAVAAPGLGNIFPFETTARQIGEANGFVVVLPTGQKMNTGSAPVSPLESPGQGVWIDYEGFTVEERKASGADLAKLIAVGSRPFAGSEPIPSDASTSSPLVSGATAYSAEYTPVPKQVAEENPPPGKRTAAFLVFEKDGVEVRLFSGSTEQLDNGKWVMVPGRTVAQLVKIAESMQPVD